MQNAESTLSALESHDSSTEIPVELISAAISFLPQILALIKQGSKAKRLDNHDKLFQVLIQNNASMEERLKRLESR